MCGITGFISRDNSEPNEGRDAVLRRMCASIIYRGPDEEGRLVRGRAALGMRRLSIIDIRSGQQPILNEDDSKAIVFNGEIYNFQPLRRELESLGHRFKTNSDTETILHAYEEFGTDCVNKLRGMFAFAIWDFREESLFIARDRVGKKPLFYSMTAPGEFVFGSELKTLLAHGGIRPEVDLAAMDAYLTFGYVPEEFCILKNVQKLPPGHTLKFESGKIKIERYWDIDLTNADEVRSEDEWVIAVREKIEEAVKIRLVSEVPLGAFLSGGVDSSAVVGMMSRLSSRPVQTFSIGFNEDSFDELKFARVAAKHFGTEHHEFIVTPDLFDLIGEIVRHFDEPFADQSSLPTFMLSRMARTHVTVALSGDGGDELFAGYSRYLTDIARSRFSKLPVQLRTHIIRKASAVLPHAAPGRNYLYNVSLDHVSRYIDSVSTFNGPGRSHLYSKSLSAALNGQGAAGEMQFHRFCDAYDFSDPVSRLLYLDSKTYLPGDILTKVDRMTMANSLEARVPLLDHELIELVAMIPSRLKLNGRESKYILKRAMKGIVPDEILYREKKGFGVPINEWINGNLRDRISDDLCSKLSVERGYFDQRYVKTLMKEHSSGRRDHSNSLWVLWMLELWFRQYIDGN